MIDETNRQFPKATAEQTPFLTAPLTPTPSLISPRSACVSSPYQCYPLGNSPGNMVSAGTKRKRRDRGNLVAAAIEDGRVRTAAERKTLGKAITPDVPDAELFTEDRKGKTKDALTQQLYEQAAEQRRAAKHARRAAPKVRKSEAALNKPSAANPVSVPEKRKKKCVGNVEIEILAKRKFDKPRGHVGNISEVIRQKKMYTDGKEDVWVGETSKLVAKEIGVNRLRITEKMNTAHRTAPSVIHPAQGLSINPTHDDHQDKLGEALANVVRKDDDSMWTDEKMKFDPALLQESKEGEVADTGMKADNNTNDVEDSSDDDTSIIKAVPERKTRSLRHKESRKREMVSNIAKKRANVRRRRDFENLDKVAEEAKKLADRLSGEEKLRKLRENPPPEQAIDEPVISKLSGQKVRNEAAVEPVTLSTELSKNMRGVKMPVANPLLRDRFLSFERRGLIEPPKVLPKEIWRMEQAKRQDELKDKRKRKGRGSRSNMTFWRNGKRAIL